MNIYLHGGGEEYGDRILRVILKDLLNEFNNYEFVTKKDDADVFLFGGGTVIAGNMNWRFLLDLDKPFAIFGSGIGDPHAVNVDPSLKEILNRSAFVGVRGLNTKFLLDNLNTSVNVEVVGDLIFSLPRSSLYDVFVKDTTIDSNLVICNKRNDLLSPVHSNIYFNDVYDFLGREGWDTELVFMGSKDLGEKIPFEEALRRLSRGYLFVGERLHVSLLGLMLGRKIIGYDYWSNKLEDALSVLKYPYFLKHDDANVEKFKKLYFKLINDDSILIQVKNETLKWAKAQYDFAKILSDRLCSIV